MRLSLLILFYFISMPTYGLIYLEPSMSFNFTGYGEETKDNGNIKKYEYNALYLGGRAGLSILSLQFGGEYFKGQSVVQIDDEDGRSTMKHDRVDKGLFINKNFESFRIYISYLFDAQLNQKGAGNRIEHRGTGQAVGIGSFIDDSLSFNFEFKNLNFSKEKEYLPNEVIERRKSDSLNVKEFIVGISWMIDIFGGGRKNNSTPPPTKKVD